MTARHWSTIALLVIAVLLAIAVADVAQDAIRSLGTTSEGMSNG